MLGRVRNSWPVRRLGSAGSRAFDALVRDNRVLPPVLALLALVLFAWVIAGYFVGAPDEPPAAGQANLVQAEDPTAQQSPAPEVEVRNVDSYAAYQNKDPFRELLASPSEDTTGDDGTSDNGTGDDGTGDDATGDDATGGGWTGDDGTGDDGRRPGGSAQDSDGDGISDERERDLGLDPESPDTDGDGIPDGEERPRGRDGRGDGQDDGRDDRPGAGRGDLQDSGGSVPRRRGLPDSGGGLWPH